MTLRELKTTRQTHNKPRCSNYAAENNQNKNNAKNDTKKFTKTKTIQTMTLFMTLLTQKSHGLSHF